MRFLLLFTPVLFFSFSLLAQTVEESDFQGKEKISSLIEKTLNAKSRTERIEQVSAAFLDVPFLNDPLGEGNSSEYDADPLCRVDGFDCTTYVETVTAIVLSKDWTEFKNNLLRIRYHGGRVSFETRNHFTEVDWIFHGKAEKIMTDITDDVGGDLVKPAFTEVDKLAWYRKLDTKRITVAELNEDQKKERVKQLEGKYVEWRRKHNGSGDVKVEEAKDPAKLNYIPFSEFYKLDEAELAERKAEEARIRKLHEADKVKSRAAIVAYRKQDLADHPERVNLALLKKIPSGTIVNYIHPDRPLKEFIGTNMIVTHQGFLIWKDGVLMARHASLNDRVMEIPFLEYIQQYVFPGKLEPRGINLTSIY